MLRCRLVSVQFVYIRLFFPGFMALGHLQTQLQRTQRPCLHARIVYLLRAQGESLTWCPYRGPMPYPEGRTYSGISGGCGWSGSRRPASARRSVAQRLLSSLSTSPLGSALLRSRRNTTLPPRFSRQKYNGLGPAGLRAWSRVSITGRGLAAQLSVVFSLSP